MTKETTNREKAEDFFDDILDAIEPDYVTELVRRISFELDLKDATINELKGKNKELNDECWKSEEMILALESKLAAKEEVIHNWRSLAVSYSGTHGMDRECLCVLCKKVEALLEAREEKNKND